MSNTTDVDKNAICSFWELDNMSDFANYLKKNIILYTLYGASDGISVTFSTLKYFCDVISPNKDIYLKHLNDVLTGEADLPIMATFAFTTAFITSISILANQASTQKDKSKDSSLESLSYAMWPYLRNALKGAKNTYKASKATLALLGKLNNSKLDDFLLPIGLSVGVICVVNRLWYLQMENERKALLKSNEKLLEKIMTCENIEQLKEYKNQIKPLTTPSYLGYFSNFLSGIIDGPYLLIGIMGLANFTPAVLLTLSIILVGFYVATITARINEEYEKQHLFEISRLRCEFEIQDSLFKLGFSSRTESENKQLRQKLLQQRKHLIDSQKRSYFSFIIEGINDGLKVFGVYCSLLFAYATISFLYVGSVSIAPVVIGLGFAIGIATMCYRTSYWLNKYSLNISGTESEQEKINSDNASHGIEEELNGNKELSDPSIQGHFQEYCEVARASTSGLSKGNNLTDFMFTTLKEQTDNGSESTSFTRWLFFAIGSINAVCLGLRAVAKGLKKAKKPVPISKIPSFAECKQSFFCTASLIKLEKLGTSQKLIIS